MLRPQPLPIGQDMALFGVYPFAGDLLCYSLNRPVDTLLPEEVKQLSLTILSVGYESFPSENQQFVQLTKQLIERVGQLSGLDLSHDTDLVKMISNHLRPMIYRLKNGINIANQTTEEIKKRYSILFHVVWLASKVLSDQYQLELLNAEIAFLTIYFEIAVEKLEKPLTIVIVCSHGLATSELIISSLRRLISHYDHLVTVDLSELDSSVARQADILISSIQLKEFPLPYVLVSPVLTNDELDNIQKLYLDLTKGNRKVLSIVHDDYDAKQALLKDLIQHEVYLHQALTSQEDCLRFLVQHAFSENRDNPGYLTSILQREKMGSTSVYTGIALPHANPEMVGRSQLSLLTLKEPVIWGKNRVKVVMLISIKEGEEELYKEALVHLYSKIDNEAFIDSLSQTADEKAFIELLLKKEED
ncbi:BglG family transcription antiterminator [Streptococcus dysgalactiae]|uniref:BglG family transcription antiterminator n=1 Tax=Streptococcus dysgalactiae TaxID=1334 RepID=UPI00211970C4|nr:PTS sugar transporter subunit IIA [Streptococcus dysgalactiae]